jgi:hypothetical protein
MRLNLTWPVEVAIEAGDLQTASGSLAVGSLMAERLVHGPGCPSPGEFVRLVSFL